MSDFEKRLRDIVARTPNMRLSTALALADRDGEPVPYPTDPSDAEATATWAAQFPEVLDLIENNRSIEAIRFMRNNAPADDNGRGLSLRHAKDAVDTLRAS